MSSDYNRWMFLLTAASLPLACSDDAPADPSGTTGAPPDTTTTVDSDSGSTSIGTTSGVDGSTSALETSGTTVDPSSGGSSSGSTGVPESSSTDASSSSSSSSGEESSSGEAPPGLCELWAAEWVACYGYYSIPYLTAYCYDSLNYADPVCQLDLASVFQCEAMGGGPCLANCDPQEQVYDACEDQLLADMLGCAMIPMVPGTGGIEMQCISLNAQAVACTNAGYYIGGFSQYVAYPPEYMLYFCEGGAYFTFTPPPQAVGDTCGGAYEELLACLSGLNCMQLEDAVWMQNHCAAEFDALTCRCELGA